jgi:hypothetical protein
MCMRATCYIHWQVYSASNTHRLGGPYPGFEIFAVHLIVKRAKLKPDGAHPKSFTGLKKNVLAVYMWHAGP